MEGKEERKVFDVVVVVVVAVCLKQKWPGGWMLRVKQLIIHQFITITPTLFSPFFISGAGPFCHFLGN